MSSKKQLVPGRKRLYKEISDEEQKEDNPYCSKLLDPFKISIMFYKARQETKASKKELLEFLNTHLVNNFSCYCVENSTIIKWVYGPAGVIDAITESGARLREIAILQKKKRQQIIIVSVVDPDAIYMVDELIIDTCWYSHGQDIGSKDVEKTKKAILKVISELE
jgi:hypothetical protein